LAGWYVGRRDDVNKDRHAFEELVRSIYFRGDTLFNDPRHHGEREFRGAMVRAGFDAKELELQQAFEKGRLMAGLP